MEIDNFSKKEKTLRGNFTKEMFVSQHGSSENIHPSVIRRLEKVKRRLFTDDDPNYQRLTTKRICYGNINRFV